MEAVPVDVTFSSFRVDMLTVGKVETPVIVLGVVGAVGSGSSIVSCQFQIDIPLFLYFLYGHSCDQITGVIQFFQAKGLAFQDHVLKSSLGIER